ncbi:hypothetical protein S40285_05911 [Stachybotrys chlorohalonatus IBT 40285]|uniref:Uncharacterized protein n=1 Tax=Stachybotrys chlorohalonatus (strain IBT 40285) TaxID=1283841 RepID=A0A084QGL1_STAC4|nr:hypothetical protein S40285_05911 [Stachybotrys chlorohalonata IBT 40285]
MSDFHRDEALCQRYAQFASHMVRWQFKIIYWTMFVANLIVLFLASWVYMRGQAALQIYKHDVRKRDKALRTYIVLCFICVMVSVVIVVMEAYALLALQFCDGEDLMSLYWSTWTMIQVGSLIAMIGIILAMVHTVRDREHPPWALALGTPVLVIAGFLHLFHDCTRKRVKKIRRKSEDVSDNLPSLSQSNTIQVPDEEDDDDCRGEFVGFTVQGGPIVKFMQAPSGPLPSNAELIGFCDNRPLVAYRKDSIRFLSASDLESSIEPKPNGMKSKRVGSES